MVMSVACPGMGGVLPIMAYTGRLRPKGVPFQPSDIKKVGISQVEVFRLFSYLQQGFTT